MRTPTRNAHSKAVLRPRLGQKGSKRIFDNVFNYRSEITVIYGTTSCEYCPVFHFADIIAQNYLFCNSFLKII